MTVPETAGHLKTPESRGKPCTWNGETSCEVHSDEVPVTVGERVCVRTSSMSLPEIAIARTR